MNNFNITEWVNQNPEIVWWMVFGSYALGALLFLSLLVALVFGGSARRTGGRWR